MVDLNWLFVLLGLGEKGAPISDNTKAWHQILLLTIVIGIWWLLCHFADDREVNPNINEVDDELGEMEHPNDELDHFFDEDDHRAAVVVGDEARGRHGGCSICGDFSTTSSGKCQIIHWRLGHKYECSESGTAADEARPTHDHGTSKLVEKSEMESTSNGSNVDDGVEWNPESHVGEEVSSGNDVNKFHGCEICGSPSTTRCSRCKAVGFLKNSYEEEESIRSSCPLSLEFHPEESTSFKSPIEVSQDPTNKVLYLEDEVAKSRNEILLLQSELDEWKNRANFAREKFRSLKRESNYQLLVLKNEKESIAEAETRARNVIHSLHKKLNHLQSECADLKKQLQEEHKYAQRLTMESDKSREAAKIAMREVEAVRQELQEEREHAQRLKENFHRDVIFSESRATFAEAKLSDLYRKIRMSDYKVCSICLSNDRDLAFGCGHMTCRDCGSKLSKCPICREQITNHIKLFTG
ncbi:E3 ubiquitin-protein ligase RGLG4 [Glycine soja]